MAFVVLDFLDSVGVAVLVAEDFKFGHIEVETARLHSARTQFCRDFPQVAHHIAQRRKFALGHLRQRLARKCGFVVFGRFYRHRRFERIERQKRVRLLVRKTLRAADYRICKPRRDDICGRIVFDEHAFHQPGPVLDQAANSVGKLERKHRDYRPDKVRRVSALCRLAVERRVLAHIARNIRYVYADFAVAVFERAQRECVVEILCVLGVDCNRRNGARIETPRDVARRDAVGQARRLRLDFGRERLREVVFYQNRPVLRHRCVAYAQILDDFAGGIHMPLNPVVELYDNLVVLLGRGIYRGLGRVGDNHVVEKARVVGDDVPEAVRAAESPDNLVRRALENPDDFRELAGVVFDGVPAFAPARHSTRAEGGRQNARQNLVAVEGNARVLGADFYAAPVVGNVEKRATALAERDCPRKQIQIARDSVSVALDLRRSAVGEQGLENLLELGAGLFRQIQSRRELRKS